MELESVSAGTILTVIALIAGLASTWGGVLWFVKGQSDKNKSLEGSISNLKVELEKDLDRETASRKNANMRAEIRIEKLEESIFSKFDSIAKEVGELRSDLMKEQSTISSALSRLSAEVKMLIDRLPGK